MDAFQHRSDLIVLRRDLRLLLLPPLLPLPLLRVAVDSEFGPGQIARSRLAADSLHAAPWMYNGAYPHLLRADVRHARGADSAVDCPSGITGSDLRWSTGPALMAAGTGGRVLGLASFRLTVLTE